MTAILLGGGAVFGAVAGWWPIAGSARSATHGTRLWTRRARITVTVAAALGGLAICWGIGLSPALLPALVFLITGTALAATDAAERRVPAGTVFSASVLIAGSLVIAAAIDGTWWTLLWAGLGALGMGAIAAAGAHWLPRIVAWRDLGLPMLAGLVLGALGWQAWVAGLAGMLVIGFLVASVARLRGDSTTLAGAVPLGPSIMAASVLAIVLV
ncbi:hypothetical protein [Agromyces mangrovi Wang et al. 2018]|uniref:hypothetical protein n=1 Tax=Agromyces mangrovi TaxID=1858653 RepID=UPI00257382BF|nr:hypothetical protein [Agromyces mangrovi]BDZ65046.1 hypothetical protein GCM10025877_19840 [Agromyces mangrovi]